MAMMVAEVLGVPFEQVRPVVGDTTAIGFSAVDRRQPRHLCRRHGGDAGGREGRRGAEEARRDHLGHQPRSGRVEGREGRSRRRQCRQLRAAGPGGDRGQIGAHRRPDQRRDADQCARPGPGFTTHICDVEVDKETGHVKILRYTAIQDVGRAIHPSYVEGQMQGGVAQGVGWALSEEYIYDKDGRLENPGFLDYRVPVASDMPMIDTVMIEVPNPRHPFGARGCRRGADRAADGGGRQRDRRRHRHPPARSADVAAEAAGRARRAEPMRAAAE